jgi:hypothetical protein
MQFAQAVQATASLATAQFAQAAPAAAVHITVQLAQAAQAIAAAEVVAIAVEAATVMEAATAGVTDTDSIFLENQWCNPILGCTFFHVFLLPNASLFWSLCSNKCQNAHNLDVFTTFVQHRNSTLNFFFTFLMSNSCRI